MTTPRKAVAVLYGVFLAGLAIAFVRPWWLRPLLGVAYVPAAGWALHRGILGRRAARRWWLLWRFCAANCLNHRAIIARGERRRRKLGLTA